MDPIYRYYNCNLQTPRLKCGLLETDQISFDSWTQSGITFETGQVGITNVMTISPTILLQTNAVGELTVYIKNDVTKSVSVLMFVITKSNSVVSTPIVPYQKVGNVTIGTVTAPSNTSISFSVNPFCEARWIWQGF